VDFSPKALKWGFFGSLVELGGNNISLQSPEKEIYNKSRGKGFTVYQKCKKNIIFPIIEGGNLKRRGIVVAYKKKESKSVLSRHRLFKHFS